MLTTYQLNNELENFPLNRMLIIIEACYSGSFITKRVLDDTISAENRIVITAAHDQEEWWWGRRPIITIACSSDSLWKNLNEGLNVKDAFTKDATALKRWDDRHYSWLDDNGDSKGNPPHDLRDDGKLAESTQIGIPNSENLALKDWGFARLFSPGELRVYDSLDRVTGLVNGEVKEEIPNSIYDEESETVAIFSSFDTYRHEIVGTDEGTYGLDIASIEDGNATTFTATDIPTSPNATHQYTINWTALSQGEEGVTVQIDSDGDGEFEQTIISTT